MVERRGCVGKSPSTHWWKNCGDPDILRNYSLFGILAGVRDDEIQAISNPRGLPEDKLAEVTGYDLFTAWYKSWDDDAHSASWVSLRELKEYRGNHTRADMQHCWGDLDDLITYMEDSKPYGWHDEDIRLCFFFDN